MAGIREELTLVDNFSGTFEQFNTAADSAVISAQDLEEILQGFTEGFLDGFISSLEDAGVDLDNMTANASKFKSEADKAANAQARVREETKKTADEAANWVRQVKGAVAALGAGKLAKEFIESADNMMLVNQRLEAVGASQEKVFQAAQRSRAEYANIGNLVAGIGRNASKTFTNMDETIQFAENISKAFKINGTDAQGAASATLQLNQALASGVLRGEEFASVNENAHIIIEKIADSIGVDVGKMKDLASQGVITADVIKNAVLGATRDINEEFDKIPMTFQDITTLFGNYLDQALSGYYLEWRDFLNSDEGMQLIEDIATAIVVLAEIGAQAFMAIANAVAFVQQNMEFFLPLFDFLIAAAIAYAAVQVWAGLQAAYAFAMQNAPLILAIGLIALAIAVAQHFGATFAQVGNVVGQIIGFLYALGYNTVANAWNLIATFGEFIANVFNDPVAAVVRLFTGAFDAILGIVETVASAIDHVLGTSMSGAISGFRGRMSGWVDAKFGESAVQIKRMAEIDAGATMTQFGNTGEKIGKGIDNLGNKVDKLFKGIDYAGSSGGSSGDYTNTLGPGNNIGDVGKVGSVGKIEEDVNMSDEDLQIYRDLAEQRYMNKIELKTLAPKINVKVPKSANLSEDDVANAVRVVLIEQMAANTATAH